MGWTMNPLCLLTLTHQKSQECVFGNLWGEQVASFFTGQSSFKFSYVWQPSSLEDWISFSVCSDSKETNFTCVKFLQVFFWYAHSFSKTVPGNTWRLNHRTLPADMFLNCRLFFRCETPFFTKDSFQPWWTSALSMVDARNSVLWKWHLICFDSQQNRRYKVFRSAYDRFHRPPPARLGRCMQTHVVNNSKFNKKRLLLDAYIWSMILVCILWILRWCESSWSIATFFFPGYHHFCHDLRFHGLETQFAGVFWMSVSCFPHRTGNAEVLVTRLSPFHLSSFASELFGWEASRELCHRNGRQDMRETLSLKGPCDRNCFQLLNCFLLHKHISLADIWW